MNQTLVRIAAAIVLLGGPLAVRAQERFERHEHHERFRHEHRYPAFGYTVTVLPTGNVAVVFGGGRYFYAAGVWYQPVGAGYVVVRPPVGIAVPVLPPEATIVSAGGVAYYYANDTYYVAGPGGYLVAAPPVVAAPVAPGPGPPPAVAVVAPGYTVTTLPAGYVAVMHGKSRFYFQAGVWYRKRGGRFVVVRPPAGIAVAALPPTATTVVIGGNPYYVANDTYYLAGPNGYVVAQPPVAAAATAAPAAPAPAAPAPTAAPASGGTWYYCDSAKAYYPYVAQCKEGWRPVPARPPGAPQ